MKFSLNDALNILSRTSKTLDSMLAGLPESWAEPNEGPNTWNVKQILQHLVFGEQTDWIPRTKIILSEQMDKTFEPFEESKQFDGFEGKSLQQLLDEFTKLRNQNLNILNDLNLTEAHCDQEGIHPALGPVTLKVMLSAWVVHDLNHIYQISRVLAKQYEQEVGPWKQYLGVLQS